MHDNNRTNTTDDFEGVNEVLDILSRAIPFPGTQNSLFFSWMDVGYDSISPYSRNFPENRSGGMATGTHRVNTVTRSPTNSISSTTTEISNSSREVPSVISRCSSNVKTNSETKSKEPQQPMYTRTSSSSSSDSMIGLGKYFQNRKKKERIGCIATLKKAIKRRSKTKRLEEETSAKTKESSKKALKISHEDLLRLNQPPSYHEFTLSDNSPAPAYDNGEDHLPEYFEDNDSQSYY